MHKKQPVNSIVVVLHLSDAESEALAQFCKRLSRPTLEAHTKNRSQADQLQEALTHLRMQLSY